MESYALKMPRLVVSGEKGMDTLAILAAQHKKAAVFTDSGIVRSGVIERPLKALKTAGIKTQLFDALAPEPTCEQAQEIVDQFHACGADLIVAVGGGSVMDIAKLASITKKDGCTVRDLVQNPNQGKKHIATVMIPTTAGTGAEATPNAIVALPEKQLKVGIVCDEMLTDCVILDGNMIRKLPRKIAASTGIDALCHAIECYISNKATPFSDLFAMKALELIFTNLEKACDDSEALDAKEKMMLAAFYGGVAITCSGTTAVHALSYPLGGRYHIPHGVSNAIMLMPVMRFNLKSCVTRFASVCDAVGGPDLLSEQEKAAWLLNRMEQMVEHLEIPSSLKDYGVDQNDLPELVRAGMEVQRLLVNNPRVVTSVDAEMMYRQVL